MRHVLFSLVVLSACSPGPAGPPGPVGPAGAAADASTIAALAMRVSELEMRGAVKVPHLILTATGQDLGPFVDWEHAWSPEIGAYYRITSRALLVYADDSCGGAPSAVVGGPDRYIAASNDRIVEATGNAGAMEALSYFDLAECHRYPQPAPQMARAVNDTGAPALITKRDALSVDLR